MIQFRFALDTQISEYYHLYCYERQEEVGHPLISVFDCIAKCNADPACANVVVIERRCQLTQFVCHDTGSSRISLNGTFGYDIYVKSNLSSHLFEKNSYIPSPAFCPDKFYDFICKSNNECSTSPQSWCSKAKNCPCTCDSTHHCVLAVCSGIAPIALFFERLRTLDRESVLARFQ